MLFETRDQGRRTKDEGPKTKDQRRRTKDVRLVTQIFSHGIQRINEAGVQDL